MVPDFGDSQSLNYAMYLYSIQIPFCALCHHLHSPFFFFLSFLPSLPSLSLAF
jgi:hypothetical protein